MAVVPVKHFFFGEPPQTSNSRLTSLFLPPLHSPPLPLSPFAFTRRNKERTTPPRLSLSPHTLPPLHPSPPPTHPHTYTATLAPILAFAPAPTPTPTPTHPPALFQVNICRLCSSPLEMSRVVDMDVEREIGGSRHQPPTRRLRLRLRHETDDGRHDALTSSPPQLSEADDGGSGGGAERREGVQRFTKPAHQRCPLCCWLQTSSWTRGMPRLLMKRSVKRRNILTRRDFQFGRCALCTLSVAGLVELARRRGGRWRSRVCEVVTHLSRNTSDARFLR